MASFKSFQKKMKHDDADFTMPVNGPNHSKSLQPIISFFTKNALLKSPGRLRRLFVVLLEMAALLALAVLLFIGVIIWRLSSGTLDAEFAIPTLEQSLARVLSTEDVDIEEFQIKWSSDRSRIEVQIGNILLPDGRQAASSAYIGVDTLALIRGDLALSDITINQLQGFLVYPNDAPMQWGAGQADSAGKELSSEARIPDSEAPLRAIDYEEILTRLEDLGLKRLVINDAQIKMTIPRLEIDWSLEGLNLDVNVDSTGFLASYGTLLSGHNAPEHGSGELGYDRKSEEGYIEAFLKKADLKAINVILPADMNFSGSVDAELQARLSKTMALQSVTYQVSSEDMSLDISEERFGRAQKYGPARLEVDAGFNFSDLSYDLASIDFLGPRLSFTGQSQGQLLFETTNSALSLSSVDFKSTMAGLDIDLRPFLEAPSEGIDAELAGRFSLTDNVFDLSDIVLEHQSFAASGNGLFDLGDNLKVKLDMTSKGHASIQQITHFWPTRLAPKTRGWIRDNITSGALHAPKIMLNFDATSFRPRPFKQSEISITGALSDARVKILSDLPLVEEGVGDFSLIGNQIKISEVSASMGPVQAEKGQVLIPQLRPAGGYIEITGNGSGRVPDILKILDETRLKLAEGLNITPEKTVGESAFHFYIKRPGGPDFKVEDLIYRFDGALKNTLIPAFIFGLDLAADGGNITVENDGLNIDGIGRLGDNVANYSYYQTFEKNPYRKAQAKVKVTPSLLNHFGVPVRSNLTGIIDLSVDAEGYSSPFDTLKLAADLEDAEFHIPQILWRKPKGIKGSSVLDITRESEGFKSDFSLSSTGLAADLDIRLNEAFEPRHFLINDLQVENILKGRGEATIGDMGQLGLNMDAEYFNAAPYLEEFIKSSLTGSGGALPAFTFKSHIDSLELRKNRLFNGVKLELNAKGGNISSASLTMMDDQNLPSSLKLPEVEDSDSSQLELTSGNIGNVIAGILGIENLRQGEGQITGNVNLAQSEIIADLYLKFEKARLKDIPAFAQLLSLASLQGLGDTLAGEGILLDVIETHLKFNDGNLTFEKGRANGPALGMTWEGWISPYGSKLDLSGVIVPSYRMNSMLGNAPVIGRMLVSRKGEGVISLGYSIKGSFEQARISVNPLSAITPGVLRRIFESEREAPPILVEMDPQSTEAPSPIAPQAAEAEAVEGETAPVSANGSATRETALPETRLDVIPPNGSYDSVSEPEEKHEAEGDSDGVEVSKIGDTSAKDVP